MIGPEMRTLRREMAMTQYELAQRLGVSRKTIIDWEASKAGLDKGLTLRLLELAGQIRVIENSFKVEPTDHNSYFVVRRRSREMPHLTAMFYVDTDLTLYGEFERREDAYRWCAALQATANPRNTRKLIRQRRDEALGGNVVEPSYLATVT